MMVQAMVIFWGFALINNGVTLNVVFAGLFIVSINTGAYMAEIVRGGIISVSKGQFEGAHAIGMTHAQTMFYVVIPQVLRNILPSVANEFVINIKDTSVLNVIGFTELYFVAYTINSINYQTFATYLLVAIIYFVLTFTITRILRLIEKKMDGKKNYTVQGSQIWTRTLSCVNRPPPEVTAMTDEIRNDNFTNETECETRADNAQNEVVIEIRHLGNLLAITKS